MPVAQAEETRDVVDTNGGPLFRLRFFDTGDGAFASDIGKDDVSVRNLSPRERDETMAALRYWAQVIPAVPGRTPAILNVGTLTMKNNAAAGSPLAPADGISAPLQVHAVLQNQPVGARDHGADSFFLVGELALSPQPPVPSQLPLGTGRDLSAVMVHEAVHLLGVTGYTPEYGRPDAGDSRSAFAAQLGDFTAQLRDDQGNPARAGQVICCQWCANPADALNPFDVRKEGACVTGVHVAEVLAGSGLRGVPVRMILLEEPPLIDVPPYLSHLELNNSLMSHQRYRNYTGFMEAELAVLQDLNYQIDRRNFFGRSVYGDHQVLVNDAPYFARNADGTAYVPNTYNTETQGSDSMCTAAPT